MGKMKTWLWGVLNNGWVIFLLVFIGLVIIDNAFQSLFDFRLFDNSLFTIDLKFIFGVSPSD